ncbi:uncharacterized protein BJ171DRAFT_477106 [Polychytrium aggregatum]|uniref:uncharacterized protein n=1 Tax=Polychytrium aggregatum TaxID=110093 RepID=UPI0022FECAD5|nr:uncharacterized protein BJ171DRAFT_477106 [Polychytrium aggregatum]KAI9202017.1 hypothetical protein BJ171DRAFT_477106 [Polychytrium aggregatum]
MKTCTLFRAVVASIAAFSSCVEAHGRMLSPAIRLLPGDAGNGYTDANSAAYRLYAKSDKLICHGYPQGPPQTTLRPGKQSIHYTITAAHRGRCEVYLDLHGGQNLWQLIGADDHCADVNIGDATMDIVIPNVKTSDGVIRWSWTADNNPGAEMQNEFFTSCADVIINGDGPAPPPPSPSSSRTPTYSPSSATSKSSTAPSSSAVASTPRTLSTTLSKPSSTASPSKPVSTAVTKTKTVTVVSTITTTIHSCPQTTTRKY